MGNRSTIARLDPEIVEQVTRLIKSGRTIDEITQHLRDLDQDVSRSAVGRYVQKTTKAMEVYRLAQERAKSWVTKLEEEPDGDVASLVKQLLSAVALQTAEGMVEGDKPVKPGDLMFMAKALRDLTGAGKTQMDVELKMRQVREEARRAALEEAENNVVAAARAQGMDDEEVYRWRRRVLGIET